MPYFNVTQSLMSDIKDYCIFTVLKINPSLANIFIFTYDLDHKFKGDNYNVSTAFLHYTNFNGNGKNN